MLRGGGDFSWRVCPGVLASVNHACGSIIPAVRHGWFSVRARHGETPPDLLGSKQSLATSASLLPAALVSASTR